jgi:hypothetical protein
MSSAARVASVSLPSRSIIQPTGIGSPSAAFMRTLPNAATVGASPSRQRVPAGGDRDRDRVGAEERLGAASRRQVVCCRPRNRATMS